GSPPRTCRRLQPSRKGNKETRMTRLRATARAPLTRPSHRLGGAMAWFFERPARAGQVIAGLMAAVALPLASLALLVSPAPPLADASSHREAPLLTQDPAADGTDFYLFTSPENNGTVTFVANYWPLEDPFAGPNYYRFDDNLVYAIKIDNNGDNQADITYEFRFKTAIKNPKTFLYNTGP